MFCPDCAVKLKKQTCPKCGTAYQQAELLVEWAEEISLNMDDEEADKLGKKSRDKGNRGELEFAKAVNGVRVPLSGNSADHGDEFSNDVILPNGWRAEVKRHKSGHKTLYGWMFNDAQKPDIVALRTDRQPWIVAMDLNHFNGLMQVLVSIENAYFNGIVLPESILQAFEDSTRAVLKVKMDGNTDMTN